MGIMSDFIQDSGGHPQDIHTVVGHANKVIGIFRSRLSNLRRRLNANVNVGSDTAIDFDEPTLSAIIDDAVSLL